MREFHFKKQIYNIYGKNAQGKTNLLEAIYITSYFRSFRIRKLQNCINYDNDFFNIKNDFAFEQDNYEHSILFRLEKNEKTVSIDGDRQKKLSGGYGYFKTILFSPYDFNLYVMGPAYRRRYFDMFISSLDKEYLITLIKYQAILKKKRLLFLSDDIDDALLKIYDEMLDPLNIKIREKRRAVITKINKYMLENFESIYKNEVPGIFYKQRQIGAHLDDYIFLLNDKSLENFGSQGQRRTFLISLKLSLLFITREEIVEKPVFLMDDVFSELDKERQNNLIDLINDMDLQVFITSIKKINDDRFENLKIEWKN